MMDSHIPLPPTYIPPEAAIQDLDATFLYVIAGMTILAMAFGNLIIWNFPPLLTLLGFRQRYITFWEFNGLIAMLLITGYIVSTINPKSNQEIWRWIDFYQFVGETAEAFLAKIWSYFTVPRLCLTLALTWVFVNIRLRF